MRSGARVRLLVAGLAAAAALAGQVALAATPIPDAPARWVTDHAGFLSPAAASELDARLGTYAKATGHQVLVYIDHTTGGDPIEDWGVRAFQRWRVGRKGIDDGLVLFIFSDDHRLRIEVGYGLEASVPDAVASQIINDRMVPQIRAGDRDGAVRSGVDALIARIGAPAGADPAAGAGPPARPIPAWKLVMGGLALLLLIGFALTHPGLAWLMLMSIGSGRGGGGGFSGGGGGGGFSGGGGSSGGGGASGSW